MSALPYKSSSEFALYIFLSSSVVSSSSVVKPFSTDLSASAWTALRGQSILGSILAARLLGMAMPRSFTRTCPW